MGRLTTTRAAVGILVIGGVFVALWLMYRPSVTPEGPIAEPPVPKLHAARASVRITGPLRGAHASIACDGARQVASGFWAGHAARACDALASTRGALLSGVGCRQGPADDVGLIVTGAFGSRRFSHRADRSGCPSVDAWLAVEALAVPVLFPQRKLEPAKTNTGT